MAVIDQKISDEYAIYNGDCIEVMPQFPDDSIHLLVYSPPFAELYNYSSSDRDLSNCRDYKQFLKHYIYVVKEISRVTMPGRISCVHCMDLKKPGGNSGFRDFPGDIIRIHQRNGFDYQARHWIWKEPLRMAIKTRALGLRHSQIVKDSSKCHAAGSEFLLVFKKRGTNPEPIAHAAGLTTYAGSTPIPVELVNKYGHGWDNPKTNRMSHWIWQHYASSFWNDIRVKRCISHRKAREKDDEKHICPLQLDVIERCIVLWSNPRDKVLTPFMGVGSEVCGALTYHRKGIGIELKSSYYKQAAKNIEITLSEKPKLNLFSN